MRRRRNSGCRGRQPRSFNSRLREEATGGRGLPVSPACGFNSRLREEATCSVAAGDGEGESVSTHASVRRRQRSFHPSCSICSFNSRLREEATYSKSREWSHEQVSTHASVRRRPPSPSTHAPFFCFNSRLREEATAVELRVAAGVRVSTHASVRRRRLLMVPDGYNYVFQLTPP